MSLQNSIWDSDRAWSREEHSLLLNSFMDTAEENSLPLVIILPFFWIYEMKGESIKGREDCFSVDEVKHHEQMLIINLLF